ncbi:large ribosomal subunit protein P2 isoform X1 [Hydra vulgaris]|uniref:large ribosomal subunit protein P2 isoform X1 n=1 Tax=Hydra vulgaris TaxID=6087 RepID=UPI001F5FCD0B|nr:60S acidic ribosomal protein P2 [Hydra vulgaris]
MRYVAAYLLATLGGNASPSENDLKKILESVGVGYDATRASTVVKQLKGKSLPDLIAEGSKKMASMPSGGAAAPSAVAAAAPEKAGGAAPAAKAEEKKKKEESEEESDGDMGFGLFD